MAAVPTTVEDLSEIDLAPIELVYILYMLSMYDPGQGLVRISNQLAGGFTHGMCRNGPTKMVAIQYQKSRGVKAGPWPGMRLQRIRDTQGGASVEMDIFLPFEKFRGPLQLKTAS